MEAIDTNLIQTALRESHEEIGIKPEEVKILGKLGDIQSTSSGYLVTPFVGVIPWPYEFNLSVDEVERVFSIPLEWLTIPNHHEEKNVEINNVKLNGVVFFQDYEGELLWGLTARITLELLRALNITSGS